MVAEEKVIITSKKICIVLFFFLYITSFFFLGGGGLWEVNKILANREFVSVVCQLQMYVDNDMLIIKKW